MAVTHVQAANNNFSASGTSVAQQFQSKCSATNTILVRVAYTYATTDPGILSVTDNESPGNSYSLVRAPTVDATNKTVVAMYVAANITGDPTTAATVTIAFNATVDFPDLVITESAGASTTAPVDQSNGAVGNSAAADSGAVTTTAANELGYAYVYAGGDATGSPGSGWSIINPFNGPGGGTTNEGGALEQQSIASSGTTVNGRFPVNSGAWTAVVVTLQPASSNQIGAVPTRPGDRIPLTVGAFRDFRGPLQSFGTAGSNTDSFTSTASVVTQGTVGILSDFVQIGARPAQPGDRLPFSKGAFRDFRPVLPSFGARTAAFTSTAAVDTSGTVATPTVIAAFTATANVDTSGTVATLSDFVQIGALPPRPGDRLPFTAGAFRDFHGPPQAYGSAIHTLTSSAAVVTQGTVAVPNVVWSLVSSAAVVTQGTVAVPNVVWSLVSSAAVVTQGTAASLTVLASFTSSALVVTQGTVASPTVIAAFTSTASVVTQGTTATPTVLAAFASTAFVDTSGTVATLSDFVQIGARLNVRRAPGVVARGPVRNFRPPLQAFGAGIRLLTSTASVVTQGTTASPNFVWSLRSSAAAVTQVTAASLTVLAALTSSAVVTTQGTTASLTVLAAFASAAAVVTQGTAGALTVLAAFIASATVISQASARPNFLWNLRSSANVVTGSTASISVFAFQSVASVVTSTDGWIHVLNVLGVPVAAAPEFDSPVGWPKVAQFQQFYGVPIGYPVVRSPVTTAAAAVAAPNAVLTVI